MKYIDIDWDLVQSHVERQSSGTAIALMLGISKECLYERVVSDKGMTWQNYKATHSSIGIEKLRSKIYDTAMSGNTAVMLFLSKNILGYSDKVEQKIQLTEWTAIIPGIDNDTEDISDMD